MGACSRPRMGAGLQHVNGMLHTISQKAARSCCAQNGLVQRHGYAVSLAAQGRRGWPCAWRWKPFLLPFPFPVIALRSRPMRPAPGRRLKAQAAAPVSELSRHKRGMRPPHLFHVSPPVTSACKPPKRPGLVTFYEAAPKGRTSQKRRTTMATKTTSTTDNNAGCSPCTPEARQRTVFQTQPDRGEES